MTKKNTVIRETFCSGPNEDQVIDEEQVLDVPVTDQTLGGKSSGGFRAEAIDMISSETSSWHSG